MEALGTELAAEGFEAGVLAAVGDEVGALAEGFPTHLAFVGLLSCRAKKMVRKISEGRKKKQPNVCQCLCSPLAAQGEKNQRQPSPAWSQVVSASRAGGEHAVDQGLDDDWLLITQRRRCISRMLRPFAVLPHRKERLDSQSQRSWTVCVCV